MSLNIYVPAPGDHPGLAHILPGSGIVGADPVIREQIAAAYDVPPAMLGPARVTIYYEGNKYGAVNLGTWEQRVKCAAGRAFERYPTVAVLYGIDVDQLVRVGQIDNHYELTVEHPELVAEYEGRPAWPSRESPS